MLFWVQLRWVKGLDALLPSTPCGEESRSSCSRDDGTSGALSGEASVQGDINTMVATSRSAISAIDNLVIKVLAVSTELRLISSKR